jgi:hypothetical protein
MSRLAREREARKRWIGRSQTMGHRCDLPRGHGHLLLGRIVNGADTDNALYHQAEGPGLQAIAEGFRHLGYKDDHALMPPIGSPTTRSTDIAVRW